MYYCIMTVVSVLPPTPGYGFVDFDSPAAAQKAVHALKTSGIQAQMAKVRGTLCSSGSRTTLAPRSVSVL